MLIILTGLCILGAAVENMSIGFVMPHVRCDLKLTMAHEGLLRSASLLGSVATSVFWGFLSDKCGRQKVLSIAALNGFFFSFLSGFTTNIHVLITFRFFSGAMRVLLLSNT